MNNGLVKIQSNATVDFSAPIVRIDGKGAVQGQATSTVHVRGSLLGNTTNLADFNMPGTIVFDGNGTEDAPQLLELFEQDVGNVAAGFRHNFAFHRVEIASGTYVKLVDLSDNSTNLDSEAGYADSLVIHAGSLFARNGFHFYVQGDDSPRIVPGRSDSQSDAAIGSHAVMTGAPAAIANLPPPNGKYSDNFLSTTSQDNPTACLCSSRSGGYTAEALLRTRDIQQAAIRTTASLVDNGAVYQFEGRGQLLLAMFESTVPIVDVSELGEPAPPPPPSQPPGAALGALTPPRPPETGVADASTPGSIGNHYFQAAIGSAGLLGFVWFLFVWRRSGGVNGLSPILPSRIGWRRILWKLAGRDDGSP